MVGKSLVRSKKARMLRPKSPVLEQLEDRCVPATGLLPSGQDLLQFYNNTINAYEANRQQANDAITALETQQINQLNQAVGAVDALAQSLLEQVSQAREQLNQ